VGSQFSGLLTAGVEHVDCHNGSAFSASGNTFDTSGQFDYLLESTCHDAVISDGPVRVEDQGARDVINNFSWNIGDPASAGAWNGHLVRTGWTIQDMTNNALYYYTSPTSRVLLSTPTTIAWKPLNEKTGASSANPAVTTAFSNALTNGSLIIVDVTGPVGMPAPTDTAGNTYTAVLGTPLLTFTGGSYIQEFYTVNAFTTASNVISFVNAGLVAYRIHAEEFSGNAASSPLDTYVTNVSQTVGTVGTQNATSTAMTTGTNGDLINCNAAFSSGPMYPGTGFVTTMVQPGGATAPEWQVQTTAGPVTATWSGGTTSDKYGAFCGAYKP
jgi:hypothetical protein